MVTDTTSCLPHSITLIMMEHIHDLVGGRANWLFKVPMEVSVRAYLQKHFDRPTLILNVLVFHSTGCRFKLHAKYDLANFPVIS